MGERCQSDSFLEFAGSVPVHCSARQILSLQTILGLGLLRFYEGTVPLCALEMLTPSLCPASCAKPWHLEFFGIGQTPYGSIDLSVRS